MNAAARLDGERGGLAEEHARLEQAVDAMSFVVRALEDKAARCCDHAAVGGDELAEPHVAGGLGKDLAGGGQ